MRSLLVALVEAFLMLFVFGIDCLSEQVLSILLIIVLIVILGLLFFRLFMDFMSSGFSSWMLDLSFRLFFPLNALLKLGYR